MKNHWARIERSAERMTGPPNERREQSGMCRPIFRAQRAPVGQAVEINEPFGKLSKH
jgi:hypothetical protein